MKRRFVLLAALASLSVTALADSRLICRLAPGVTSASIATKYQMRLLSTAPGGVFAYYSVANSVLGDQIQVRMATDPAVVWSEDETVITTPEGQKGSTLPAVGDRAALQTANSQFLQQVNWSASVAAAPGRLVKVAILDSGLSPYQPYLWHKVYAYSNIIEPAWPPYDMPRGQDSNRDGIRDGLVGHGTMVAGIIDQMSPNSRFVIVRVADSDGRATAWSLIKGLSFAALSGAEIANVSLGTLSPLPAMSDVLDWCKEKGLTVVGAIGNNNLRDACTPARLSGAVCVGGLQLDNKKASFSNWQGSCLVSAPAVGITSQDWNGRLGVWSGTSFSTPMVTAALAEAYRRNLPNPTFDKVKTAFRTLGTDIDSFNPSYRGELGKRLDFTRFVNGFKGVTP